MALSTFVIGDVHGCLKELEDLLILIDFKANQDHLWFCGDLVNRGPDSLGVLRLVKQLPQTLTVLGNHDLYCLSVWCGLSEIHREKKLQTILAAPDCDELMHWLRKQPLMLSDHKHTVVHAGLPPQWNTHQASYYAKEVEQALSGHEYRDVLLNIEGNQPDAWDESLTSYDRLRYIINALTRIRFVTHDGRLDLENKGPPESAGPNETPWYASANRASQEEIIIHGHWASLNGKAKQPKVFSLDTGCVWHGALTALRLDDYQLFQVPARRKSTI